MYAYIFRLVLTLRFPPHQNCVYNSPLQTLLLLLLLLRHAYLCLRNWERCWHPLRIFRKMAAFWAVSCWQRFERAYCLRFQRSRKVITNTWRYEHSSKHRIPINTASQSTSLYPYTLRTFMPLDVNCKSALSKSLQSVMGTAVAQWLRCCATNRKVAVSIPNGVTGIFVDTKSFLSHYGPGVDSASNRNE